MTKELTDKVKQEIVERQIEFLKVNYPNEGINYEKLKFQLSESLKEYPLKKGDVNQYVDLELLKTLENGNLNTISRMFNVAMDFNNFLVKKGVLLDKIKYREDVKDMHLIRTYEHNQESRNGVRNCGAKTAQLLEDYLIKKGLIEIKK